MDGIEHFDGFQEMNVDNNCGIGGNIISRLYKCAFAGLISSLLVFS